jgi:hypothetical protein
MKLYEVSEGIVPLFLILALEGSEWSAPHPGHLTPGERARGTHWIGSCVSPRGGLDIMERRKISCPCHESKYGCQAHSPLLYWLSYPNSYNTTYSTESQMTSWRVEEQAKLEPAWSRQKAKHRQQLASCWFIVTFLQHISRLSVNYIILHPRKYNSS